MFAKWVVTLLLLWTSGSLWAVNDPMRPPFFDGSTKKSVKVSSLKPLVLTMILNSNQRKVAVINGVSVQEGDTVAGHRVVKIAQQKVVVARKGKVKDIFLGKPQQRGKTKVSSRSEMVED